MHTESAQRETAAHASAIRCSARKPAHRKGWAVERALPRSPRRPRLRTAPAARGASEHQRPPRERDRSLFVGRTRTADVSYHASLIGTRWKGRFAADPAEPCACGGAETSGTEFNCSPTTGIGICEITEFAAPVQGRDGDTPGVRARARVETPSLRSNRETATRAHPSYRRPAVGRKNYTCIQSFQWLSLHLTSCEVGRNWHGAEARRPGNHARAAPVQRSGAARGTQGERRGTLRSHDARTHCVIAARSRRAANAQRHK
jgi:hypothetical protein